MKRILIRLFVVVQLLGLGSLLNAQTYITHDFNDGNFTPYEVNKADQEARVNIVNSAVETHWDETLYNGTNSGRKAQFRPINDIIFTQHIWMGLRIKIHSDYMQNNTNTNAGLMQIWGYNGSSGAANHMCMLKFDGRNGGALVWQHRYNSVANKTHYLVEGNFPRDQFVDVVVHVKLAEYNKGTVQVWVDDVLKLNKTNQTIGWGDMNSSGMINGTYCFGTSIGQYNFFVNAGYDDAYDGDDHWFDGHLAGETRTVTYDNVSLYNGANGYDLVDPTSNNGGGTNVALGGTVTQSSTAYSGVASRAIDGDTNGAWSDGSVTHTANEAQPWLKVDLGSSHDIDEIVVWGRTDSCCANRLSNYDVSILDSGNNVVWSNYQSGTPSPSVSIDANGATGRYVLIELNGTNPLSVAELEVFGEQSSGSPITNLAENQPVTVSGEQSGNPGSNAVDDDTNTRWSVSGFPQWLEVDLGSVKSISKTELVCFSDRAYQFIVESKTSSGGSYTQIVDRSSNTTSGTEASPITDTFSATDARYVRITVQGASGYSGSWVSQLEFRVFGN
ncbi:discoidin domain-containing protein [Puniceicoccaceae bacterium K14]|nr:discoidin domain-containing protein [Puniceicoccaceae bacterium K14]